jgi:hypothetical protein
VSDYLDQPRTYTTEFVLVPGATVEFFVTGGETPATVYNCLELREDDAGDWVYELSAPLPVSFKSDGAARLPLIFRDPEVTYRMRMTAPDGTVLHDLDPFTIFPGPELITPLTDSGAAMPGATLAAFYSQTDELAVGPITADGNGEFAALELSDGVAYRVQLKSAAGVLVYDVDPYPGDGSSITPGGGGGGPPADAPVIELTDHTLIALGVGDPGTLASCSVYLTNAGGMNLGTGFGTSGSYTVDDVTNPDSVFAPQADEWVTADTRVYLTETDAYAVRLTVLSGDPPGAGSSAIDEWIPIGGPFGGEASFLETVEGGSSFSAEWFLEIRDVATETVLASCTLTLSATSSP